MVLYNKPVQNVPQYDITCPGIEELPEIVQLVFVVCTQANLEKGFNRAITRFVFQLHVILC